MVTLLLVGELLVILVIPILAVITRQRKASLWFSGRGFNFRVFLLEVSLDGGVLENLAVGGVLRGDGRFLNQVFFDFSAVLQVKTPRIHYLQIVQRLELAWVEIGVEQNFILQKLLLASPDVVEVGNYFGDVSEADLAVLDAN